MAQTHAGRRRSVPVASIARIAVGLIWLAGAVINGLVKLRMSDPYGWIAEESPFSAFRWFFGEVVGAHSTAWTVLLIAGEAAVGVLTLAKGGWGRLGLAGGALFSAFLFSLGSPYTLMMGPYALLLAWLAWRTDGRWPARPVRRLGPRRAIVEEAR